MIITRAQEPPSDLLRQNGAWRGVLIFTMRIPKSRDKKRNGEKSKAR